MKDFLGKSHSGFFSIIDSERVLSLEQIRICHSKAIRLTGTSGKIRMPESAFLMLLSGNHQISRAHEDVGITSSTKTVLVVYESPQDYIELLDLCGKRVKPVDEIPVPETDREKDSLIFSRMAHVQINL